MRIAPAVILLAHGFAHVPGFVVPWRLATPREMPYKTTLFAGHVNVGDQGIRVAGILWLLTVFALGVCAAAVLARLPWWTPATLIVASLSLVLSIAGWPDSRMGVFVNLALLALLLINRRVGWLR